MEFYSTTSLKVDIFKLLLHNRFNENGEYDFTIAFDIAPKLRHEEVFSVYSYLNSLKYKVDNENLFSLAMIDFIGSYFELMKSAIRHAAIQNSYENRREGEEDSLYG